MTTFDQFFEMLRKPGGGSAVNDVVVEADRHAQVFDENEQGRRGQGREAIENLATAKHKSRVQQEACLSIQTLPFAKAVCDKRL